MLNFYSHVVCQAYLVLSLLTFSCAFCPAFPFPISMVMPVSNSSASAGALRSAGHSKDVHGDLLYLVSNFICWYNVSLD